MVSFRVGSGCASSTALLAIDCPGRVSIPSIFEVSPDNVRIIIVTSIDEREDAAVVASP
jgi:hypothetical protein